MLTIIETGEYLKQAAKLFAEEERAAIVAFLSGQPEAGDVIPGTGGLRKLRWKREGRVSAEEHGLFTTIITTPCPSPWSMPTPKARKRT